MIMGPCYVIMGTHNENTGPWDVNCRPCNVIMGQRNMIVRPRNVNRGLWNDYGNV